LQTGIEALYHSAINGKGAMPPRGGSSASDADVHAAVDFMTAAAK
jgi:cytochrome c5